MALRVFAAYAQQKTDPFNLYAPLAPAARFHASNARVRLVSGPNQSGKTNAAIFEMARLHAGKDPYKKRADKNLRMYTVGKDEQHLADPLAIKLLWPGMFDCIIDEKTGLLRAVRVDPLNSKQVDPLDMARREEWEPCPPVFTENTIDIKWNKRGLGVPKILIHKLTGSKWWWFTSKSDPRQGGQVDVFHCDEEIERRGGKSWISEGQARTLKRAGIQIYSYTPQAATPEYFEFHKRVLRGEPNIEEFTISIDDNPYIPAEAKQALYEDLKHDPDELAVRYFGQYAISQRRVYPQYDPNIHRIDDCAIPEDWMRLMVIDPGSQWAGILFAAVPPEEDCVHVYGELFPRNKTAAQIAELINRDFNACFESFIIDERAARQKPFNMEHSVSDHWVEAFQFAGLASRQTGHHFQFGSDNIAARETSLKRWMNTTPPLLKIHRLACPVLDRQLQNRHFDKANREKRDERQQHDLVDTLEYLAAWFDEYVSNPSHPYGLLYLPPDAVKVETEDERVYKAFLKKKRERRGPGGVTVSYGPRYRPTSESLELRS